MARPLRIEFAGALYHVTSRGDGREDIFRDDRDRRMLLGVLAHVIERMHWQCHAYCLMGNHYHLLIETPNPNLARGMRQLNGIYTQRFNWRHARSGHVFQGRYHAILVDRDSYLLELARYIVLNPVRAAFIHSPGQWAWSSYRATAGLEAAPRWLTVEGVLGQFGTNRTRSRVAYAEFVHQGNGSPSVWEGLRQQIYLGDDQFIERVLGKTPSICNDSEVPRIQRRLARSLEWYERQYRGRAKAMVEAYRSGNYSLSAIARHFGVHYSTVSRVAKGAEVCRVR
jgi:putative transposase